MNNFDGAWYYVSIDFLGEVKYGYLSEIVFFGQKGYSEVMFGI